MLISKVALIMFGV